MLATRTEFHTRHSGEVDISWFAWCIQEMLA